MVVVEGNGRLRARQRAALQALYLRAPHFHVLETASAVDALTMVEIVEADMLIVGESLSDMEGVEFCRKLRRIRKASLLPLILLGPSNGVSNEAEALAAGADEYLRLPVHPSLLHARILTHLRRKWASDEREDVESILFALAQTVEQRDASTGGHCQRLADLSVKLGRRLGLSTEENEALWRGGFLHDIGKIAVPDSILFKPGPLTEAEWVVMRHHTTRGEEICKPMRTLSTVLPIIRNHHERWDGSGYPDGLRGEEIPLLARILQVVDIYDALTTLRPYKPAMTHREAMEALKNEVRMGLRDPDLVHLFADMFPAAAVLPLRRAAIA